jgi:Uma2 family endonuclease
MSLAAQFPHRLFTSEEVLRMVEVGILREDEPLELLEGELIEVTPQGPPHANVAALLGTLLARLYQADFTVRQSAPLEAGHTSLPEPDVAVVRGSLREFMTRHPKGEDTVLVIEVARTSHAIDRLKVSIYARAKVPVYWLVDVTARRVEVHEDPQPDGRFRLVRVLAEDDKVTPPGTQAAWTVAELMP